MIRDIGCLFVRLDSTLTNRNSLAVRQALRNTTGKMERYVNLGKPRLTIDLVTGPSFWYLKTSAIVLHRAYFADQTRILSVWRNRIFFGT